MNAGLLPSTESVAGLVNHFQCNEPRLSQTLESCSHHHHRTLTANCCFKSDQELTKSPNAFHDFQVLCYAMSIYDYIRIYDCMRHSNPTIVYHDGQVHFHSCTVHYRILRTLPSWPRLVAQAETHHIIQLFRSCAVWCWK